mgnify:CR=1 FL=1
MNAETQAVLFNAVPLLMLAALYLAAAGVGTLGIVDDDVVEVTWVGADEDLAATTNQREWL